MSFEPNAAWLIGREQASARVGRGYHAAPPAQDLLHDLRDTLFAISGAISEVLPGVSADAAALLERIGIAARQASDRARMLADVNDPQIETRAQIAFNPNDRLRCLRPALQALLPSGAELRLRLAAGLWSCSGNPDSFDEAVIVLVREIADAMRREALCAPVVILTRNRASAPPNGDVRVSVVSDIAWLSDDASWTPDLRRIRDDLAHHGGRLLGADRRGYRAVAHMDLRRSLARRLAAAPLDRRVNSRDAPPHSASAEARSAGSIAGAVLASP